MIPAVIKIGWLCIGLCFAVALSMARSCGFTPDDRKGEGEPCTRTSECDVLLECRGGVCMPDRPDGGRLDASAPRDASPPPDGASAGDAALDARVIDASAVDAQASDASRIDASGAADGG